MSAPSPAPSRALRILMLAPEPFFEPRGTPFSEFHRIKALGALGHHVDLVTYPIGRDVDLPNLRIFRSPRPPFVTRVPIGPSAVKVVLDVLMLFTIARRAMAGGYDAIHSHEEMGLVGVWLAKLLGIPHLYDMHSSLPQQLSNFKFSGSSALRAVFDAVETQMVGKSDVVITICQELQDTVVAMGHGERALLIENVMGGDVEDPPTLTPAAIRERWGIAPEAPIVLYTGTFEAYQGLEMLIDAAVRLAATHPAARVLIVGGDPAQVATAQALAASRGATSVVFTGQQPAREIPAFVASAAVLASPRIRGTNTPLKIYSYLRSGTPIVATNLLTHTQVLSPAVARLTPPEAAPFAAAIAGLLDDPAAGRELAAAAKALSDARYSREVYLTRTADACRRLAARGPAASADAGTVAR
ncbi:MAG: glycosyltransferase [Acidobacteria bacterium]|nr:glycosyltransferase [Acidobacteriota bacterium]